MKSPLALLLVLAASGCRATTTFPQRALPLDVVLAEAASSPDEPAWDEEPDEADGETVEAPRLDR